MSLSEPSNLSQLLIPIAKEEWSEHVSEEWSEHVSEEEALYQEHWGEYESWWWHTGNDEELAWWHSLNNIPHGLGELVRKENGTWCILPNDWQESIVRCVVGVPPGEHVTLEEPCDRHEIIESFAHYDVTICLGCGRAFDDDHRLVGTVLLDTVALAHGFANGRPSFKCEFCGPPVPSGEELPDIIFRRWTDYDKVDIGMDGGCLTIVHATYGGPSCPNRDVTAKLRRAVDFQHVNLGHNNRFVAERGIYEWIGDPEPGVAKVLRIWYTLKTPRERRAIEILGRFFLQWREYYYKPGGRFESMAASRFESMATSSSNDRSFCELLENIIENIEK